MCFFIIFNKKISYVLFLKTFKNINKWIKKFTTGNYWVISIRNKILNISDRIMWLLLVKEDHIEPNYFLRDETFFSRDQTLFLSDFRIKKNFWYFGRPFFFEGWNFFFWRTKQFTHFLNLPKNWNLKINFICPLFILRVMEIFIVFSN